MDFGHCLPESTSLQTSWAPGVKIILARAQDWFSELSGRGSGRGGNSPQDRAQPWRNSACFSHSFPLSRHKLFLQEALRHLTLPLSARGGGCPQRGPCLDPTPIFPLGPFSYPRGGLYLPSHSSELLGSRLPPFPSPHPALPPNPSSNVPTDPGNSLSQMKHHHQRELSTGEFIQSSRQVAAGVCVLTILLQMRKPRLRETR